MTKKLKKLWRENCAVKATADIAEYLFKNPRMSSAGFLFLRILPAVFFLLTLTSSWIPAYAESEVMVTEEITQQPFGDRKNISGQVGASNNEGLALVIKTNNAATEREMWLPFAVGMRYNGYTGAGDIKQGDTVNVIYEEGGGKRVLREVTFSQSAPEQAPQAEEEIPEPEIVEEEAAAQ